MCNDSVILDVVWWWILKKWRNCHDGEGMNLRQMNRTQVSSFICCSCLRSCAQGFLFFFFFLSQSWMSQKSEVYGSHVWTMFLSVLNKRYTLANKSNGYLNVFRMYHSRKHSVLLSRGGKTSSVKTQTGLYASWLRRCLWQERNTDERVQLALQES